jgi:Putative prokaryotic signal transducing protein
MANFVTLTTFENSIEAHIVKNLLESELIAVFLVGEHFFNTQKLFNVALADIRLQVPAGQLTQAKQLLVDYKQGTLEQPLNEEFDLIPTTCKQCGSNEIKEISARPSLIAGALLQIFLIGLVLPPTKYKICKRCKSHIQDD